MEKAQCYKNRELSWLQFNERVLDEAGNDKVPLAERLTFTSIFQNNLDEFFMVRVGTLMVQIHSGEEIRENKTNMTSHEQVDAILKRVKALENKKAKIYEALMSEIQKQGVSIVNFSTLTKDEGKKLKKYFEHNVAPFLSPMIVGKQQPFPFLNNKEMYVLVVLSNKKGKNKIGIIPCSNSVLKRLIEIPAREGNYMLVEELILHFVEKMYPQYNVVEKSIIRVTRNADLDEIGTYDEDLDYRDTMAHLIKQRKRLSPVRLEISRELSPKVKKELADTLGLDKSHIIKVNTPLVLNFVFQLQQALRDKTELFYEKRTPRPSAYINPKRGMFEQIREKDILLHYPYESIKPFLKMLHEAAEDKSVVSIKMTLYRVADKSKVVDALVEAAENGKEVVVMVELRARFDEQNNIEMSRRLEDAGCRIIYGLDKYKVHSKLCLITRKTEEGFEYITQIGTGNYNEKTAALYTDLSLMTANQEIGAEAAEVFATLLQGETVKKTKHLLVAPNCLQNHLLDRMDAEIKKAKKGSRAYIGIKMNSLTDKIVIDKLIEASKAGVKIELIVRGICCLVPGIAGETENIKVVSVVGRFLEHSRIYIFGKGAEEKIYIASADLMTRNTVCRVEVAAPIYDEDIKNRVRSIFDTTMSDTEKGKLLNNKGKYSNRRSGKKSINAQELFYQNAYEVSESIN